VREVVACFVSEKEEEEEEERLNLYVAMVLAVSWQAAAIFGSWQGAFI
jgi:hypothetical protein